MRKKIALLSLVSAFVVSFAAVPSANAAYIYATLNHSAVDICRTAPDVLSYRLEFKVKFKRSGVAAPKKVRIGFQVLNADSKQVLRSGVVNVKRSKGYKGKTRRISATAGMDLRYHLTGKFTVNGKSTKNKFTYSDFIPSVEVMDAAGVPNC